MSKDPVAADPAPGVVADPAPGAVVDPAPDVVADPVDAMMDPGPDPFADPVTDAVADDDGGILHMGPMCQVEFGRVEVLLPSTNPIIVLEEKDPPHRELRITIGGAEGIAIGYAARGMATPKPLTHELFTRVMELFNLSLDVVRITAVRGTSFSGEVVVSGPSGSHVIDCRPSDAIALALRQRLPVPIMVVPEVLDEAGVLNS
jgi:bifunctional DNase/RNase